MEKDPIARYLEVSSLAKESGIELPEAATLATVGEDGQPTVRTVLIKDADEQGFVFYTNMRSPKGRQLTSNPRAALCWWWESLQHQVTAEGRVERVSDSEADEYFATRDRPSQIGAWASHQSDELPSRDVLTRAFDDVSKRFENRDVPRPSHWSGYRLYPDRIEFWMGRPHRLHERHCYTRQGDDWVVTLLYP